MSWVRLDDDFYDHPRFANVSALGVAWWIVGLAWCNRNLTDGRIPMKRACLLLPLEGVAMVNGSHGEDATADNIIGELLDAGLWEEVEGFAFQIRDYHQYQRTSDEIRGADMALAHQRSLAGKARAAGAQRDQRGRLIAAGHDQQDQHDTSDDTSDVTSAPPASSPSLQPQLEKTTSSLARDELFESIAGECGLDWHSLTTNERGRLNKATKQLRAVEATPASVCLRASAYRRQWPDVSLTPLALASNWGQLEVALPAANGTEPKPDGMARIPAPRDCETCNGTQWLESDEGMVPCPTCR